MVKKMGLEEGGNGRNRACWGGQGENITHKKEVIIKGIKCSHLLIFNNKIYSGEDQQKKKNNYFLERLKFMYNLLDWAQEEDNLCIPREVQNPIFLHCF